LRKRGEERCSEQRKHDRLDNRPRSPGQSCNRLRELHSTSRRREPEHHDTDADAIAVQKFSDELNAYPWPQSALPAVQILEATLPALISAYENGEADIDAWIHADTKEADAEIDVKQTLVICTTTC
jgi:hypothetical protein